MAPLNRGLLTGCLFLTAVGSLQAQDASSKSYNLVMKFVAGDTLKYKYGTNMAIEIKGKDGAELPIPAQEMIMSATMKQKVIKVNEDGSADIQSTMQKGVMTMMGNETPMPDVPPTLTTVSKNGSTKIKEKPKSAGGGMTGLGNMLNMDSLPTNAVFPDHPVKVGDSWNVDLPSPFGEGKISVASSLISVDTTDGKDVLKIKQVTTMPMKMFIGNGGAPVKTEAESMMGMSGTIKVDSFVYVQADDCRLVKTTGTINATIAMKMGATAAASSPFGDTMNMSMKGTMDMKLTSAGPDTDPPAPVKTVPTKAATPTKKPTATKKP